MLYLIGIGLRPEHISIEAMEAVKECAAVFLETYTSKYSEGGLDELQRIFSRKILPLQREQVENSELLLSQAQSNKIALLIFGNPLTATTHIQLMIDAEKDGVKCKIIPGISITDFVGKTGLSSYRFGRVATIVTHEENYRPESFYDQILENKKNNLHTLCLLDINEKRGLMSVNDALSLIEGIEKKRKTEKIKNSTLVLLCGMGNKDEVIKAGSFAELKRSGYAVYPQSFIVCAELNEKEKEALEILYGWNGK